MRVCMCRDDDGGVLFSHAASRFRSFSLVSHAVVGQHGHHGNDDDAGDDDVADGADDDDDVMREILRD
ncbi:hypothetical protein L596_005713 [Steinernema carpocapsae]|uniref:Uncharacterized protein n=1 Tax=Steinernema carpocapsae TaxID=34508 RepID=A0A4U8V009_STECR|nr:hypothetical protein L596_005713 [Steinernema carpocapsae]